MALAIVPDEVKKAVPAWEAEVEERRKVTSLDPVADAMAYCASDLKERIKRAEATAKTLSTTEWGRLHGARDSTVRKWIAAGELEAHQNSSGDWEIPRHATRRRNQRKRKARA